MKKGGASLAKYLLREHERNPELRIRTMLSTAEKLGDTRIVMALNLPLSKTCCAERDDGFEIASPVCRANCYYWKMIEGRSTVAKRADLTFEIMQREDAHLLMAGAIGLASVSCFRLHDFGDYFSVPYIETIDRVIRICHDIGFGGYTRGWRVDDFIDPLARLAALPNMHLLLSADRLTGMPPAIPNTRVAWLADSDADLPPERVHVIFRASGERTPDGYETELTALDGSPVCPHESGVFSETEPAVDKRGRVRKKRLGPPDCVSCRRCLFRTHTASPSEISEPGPVTIAV